MNVPVTRLMSVGCVLSITLAAGIVRAADKDKDDEDDLVVAAHPTTAPNTPPPSVEERLNKLEAANTARDKEAEKKAAQKPEWLKPFSVTGYVQGEYQSHQDSEDQLQQGQLLLNKDRFLLRRARVRLDADWQFAHAQLEIDGNTKNGPQMRMLHAFATLKLPRLKGGTEVKDVPVAAVTLGLFDTPFGYELGESPRTRFFMERSLASQSFFPGEPDVGIKFWGGLYFVRWSIAALNGEPLDEKVGFPGQSAHSAKDVVFKVGIDTHPRDDLQISGNVSGLRGQGFHSGLDATKNTIVWRDANEDGNIQPSELTGQPATAATPSVNYPHWAFGADLQVRLKTRFGQTMAYGEVVVASNLDRGLYPADPVLTGIDVREVGAYAGILQDVTRYGVVGFRWDFYDPNSDFLDKRNGKLIPTNQTIQSFSPLIGLVLPDRARLMFQYDVIRNHYARDVSGLPTNLKANAWTVRLQVQL